MRKRRAPMLTYANVTATIALFGVVAGGGAYAAQKIGAKDIRPNAIRTKHLKNGGVKAQDLGAMTGFARRHQSSTPERTVLSLGGLRLRLRCEQVQPDIYRPQLSARSAHDDAYLDVTLTPAGSAGQTFRIVDADLDRGEEFDLDGDEAAANGTLVYVGRGQRAVAVDFGYETASRCLLAGVAIGG